MGHFLQNAHPNTEQLFGDAAQAAEVAQNEGVFWQLIVSAFRKLISGEYLLVQVIEGVGLIAVRHVEQLFCVELAVLVRADMVVHDIIIDVPGAHCSGIREVHDLQRGGTKRADTVTITRSMPIEIDQNMDTVLRNHFCTLAIRKALRHKPEISDFLFKDTAVR